MVSARRSYQIHNCVSFLHAKLNSLKKKGEKGLGQHKTTDFKLTVTQKVSHVNLKSFYSTKYVQKSPSFVCPIFDHTGAQSKI